MPYGCLGSSPTPGTTLETADLLLTGVAEQNGDRGGGGVHGVVFLPPAAWPPPADGSPPGRRGRGQFGFTTLLPSPLVSGGQQKRKRYTDFLLGSGAREPGGVLREGGRMGGEMGGAEQDLPANPRSAWSSPAPFTWWPSSGWVSPGLEPGEQVRLPAVLTHCS